MNSRSSRRSRSEITNRSGIPQPTGEWTPQEAQSVKQIARELGFDPEKLKRSDMATLTQLSRESIARHLGVDPAKLKTKDRRAVAEMSRDLESQPEPIRPPEPELQPSPARAVDAPSTASPLAIETELVPRVSSNPPATATKPQSSPLSSRPKDTMPREPKTAPAIGRTSEVHIPEESTRYPVRYVVRELEDVYASHNGQSFAENVGFEYRKDRNYSNAENAARVVDHAAHFEPSLLLTDSLTATNGPTIIDSRGNSGSPEACGESPATGSQLMCPRGSPPRVWGK